MKVTIIHLGGSTKKCDLEEFDAPRPWVRLRYPGGGGVWAFSLAHGGIESKRNTLPEWRITDADLVTVRQLAKEQDIKFSAVPFKRAKMLHEKQKPGAPRRKASQKQLDLFDK